MKPIRRRPWDEREDRVTPPEAVLGRRRFLQGSGAVATAPLFGWFEGRSEPPPEPAIAPERYPAARSPRFADAGRPLTPERYALSYNNFYEFGTGKDVADAAQALRLRPWTVRIDGLVEREIEIDAAELIRRMPLEERIYRFRCVEAWAMVVPWTGFPLAELVAFARPLSAARYVRFETFLDPDTAPGQRLDWFPWPYVEGLTLEEATNELALMATGLYGRPLERQNGAPLRLVVPWKYGFKSIKSIRRITFTAERPRTFWSVVVPHEYGFWANVNPDVPHPRWSQRTERLLGSDERVPTRIYNGYGAWVGHLYRGLAGEELFR
ncbi:Protein-methionine-sulfoxide reductase catalytic subunit MsrP [bacterium HR39]|nr:Protein-methionine-sulfoxide reductase catalytic subunit MsrP [bacterium HR39]